MIDMNAALAEALHDTDDHCNANFQVPIGACATAEWDRVHALEVADALRRLGWMIVRDPAGTAPVWDDES